MKHCRYNKSNIWIYIIILHRKMHQSETFGPRQNGCHFVNDILESIFLYGNCSDNGMAPNRRQAITWANSGLVYWRRYASLGLNYSIWSITFVFHSHLQISNEITGWTEGAAEFQFFKLASWALSACMTSRISIPSADYFAGINPALITISRAGDYIAWITLAEHLHR